MNSKETLERFSELMVRYEEHILIISSLINSITDLNPANEHFLYVLEKETIKLANCRKEISFVCSELKLMGIELKTTTTENTENAD